jgi:hypothetical protein
MGGVTSPPSQETQQRIVMKKAFFSALCSAFVIPGLGQVINQDLRKGVCILSAVFVLFLAGVIIVYRLVNSILKVPGSTSTDFTFIVEKIKSADFSLLGYLLIAFALIWFYSVVDAFLRGRKLDQLGERNQV